MIEFKHLSKRFSSASGMIDALQDVNLSIADGDIFGVIGFSGAGKSTLLRMVNRLEDPTEGEVLINGVNILAQSHDELRRMRKKIGMVFQQFNLLESRTVYENVALPLILNKTDAVQMERTVTTLLQFVGLSDKKDAYPSQLSGGQKQRVALARILASDPEVLMLDEPFSALDAFLKEKLQLELLELLSGYDKDILMVTHSRDEIYRFCEHMLIVENGRQAGFGATKEIFKNPGTPAAAKLTGCKNIEKIERVDDHTMVLPNWNTTVCVKGMIPENTTHIGIRAHYLRLPENGQRENLVECQNGKILDDPFELVVVFEHDVWWKIPKESWQKEYQEKMPQYLAIPEESILYLHG